MVNDADGLSSDRVRPYANPVPTHRPTRAYEIPGLYGPVLCRGGPLRISPSSPSSTNTLSVSALATYSRRWSIQPTQLTSRIDAAAWPEILASCHQSLRVLRSAARFMKAPGRNLKLGVRKLRMALPFVCFRI